MPMLHKKTFVKKKIAADLKPTDKVFFCDLTEEIFTDYDEFWERLVLLNALVWTCEFTGRPNLTYQEALESENKARNCVSNIAVAIKKPMMFIATYTRRGKISDMSDDVFNYIRDRYFVGEDVEAIVAKHWYDCKVTKVIMPTKEEIILYQNEIAESEEDDDDDDDEIKDVTPKRLLVNGSVAADDDDDIMIIRDDHEVKNNKSEDKVVKDFIKKKDEIEDYPPFPTVKYEVIEIDPWDYKECKKHIVSWDQIRRNKSSFTREKCKLFLKQCVRMNLEGYWTLKDIVVQSYNLKTTKYSNIFVGNPPKFPESKVKKPLALNVNGKNKERTKSNKEKDFKNNKEKENKHTKDNKKEAKKKNAFHEKIEDSIKKVLEKVEVQKKAQIFMTEEEKEAIRQKQMEERERLREKHKEEIRLRLERMRAAKKKERDLQKEEKRILTIFQSHYNRKREDLECDDHKDLPTGTPIQCRIPLDLFGDFIMLLEFVNAFTELLELKDVYPNGINFDMMEHALVEKEVAGVFNDIIQLLLGAIFTLQEEEDEEVEGDSTVDMASMDFESNLESKSLMSALNLANKAATWSQQYQGVSLQKAPLDALTLTEILRLHILASGASNVANAAWRHMYRGGYKPTDDPGLQFKLEEPEIIKKLTSESLFDLTISEKMKVLIVLTEQILTYASVRDSIDDRFEKMRENNNSLRLYRFAEMRKEREEVTAKKQKQKVRDEKLKKKKLESSLKGEKQEGEVKAEADEDEEEEETEEQRIAREEKEEKQKERRKQESAKKEKEFLDKINLLTRGFRQCPLGEDRAFRKYWVFNTLPGLFIEDCDPNPGVCLDKPTPIVEKEFKPEEDKELINKIKIQALKNMEQVEKVRELDKNNSDKENENNDSPMKKNKVSASNKKLLQTPNENIVVGTDSATPSEVDYSPKEDEEEMEDLFFMPPKTFPDDHENFKELHTKIFGLCSASEGCPVHIQGSSRPRWSFIHTVDMLQNLIDSLNSKGNRESELKEYLVGNKDKIESSLLSCPAYKLDPSQEPADVIPQTQRKSERNSTAISSPASNLNFLPGTPIDKILESTMRDMILEFEEKVDHGMLGKLKAPERDVWRQAIAEGTSLSFSNPQELDWGGKKRIKQFKSDLGIEVDDDTLTLDTEELMSRDGLTQAGVVKELAIAILQVSQSVEPKYIKAPLAEADKMLKKRQKAENRLKKQVKKDKKDDNVESSSEDEDESFDEKNATKIVGKVTDNAIRTPIERWEKSLMACTSFSQLFLHLATLDNSISWSRSAVNTRCSICRRKSDPENMLLCDECDRGFHMFCLKPVMKSIPIGDWYCDKCKPKLKPKSPKKQRKIYKDISDDELDDDVEEESEEEGEAEPFVNHEYCDACEQGGEIICCDTCPRSFHLDCANIRKIPRGDWSCSFCKDEQTASASRKSKSRVKKKDAKRRTVRKVSDEDFLVEEIENRKRGTKRNIQEVETDDFHKSSIENLISDLCAHKDAWPFLKPVFKQDVPDYYEKIKKPVDLKTIKIRYNKDKYTSDAEFIADVLLIFQNCQQYYQESDEEYKSGTRLSKYFLSKVKSYKLSNINSNEESSKRPTKRKR